MCNDRAISNEMSRFEGRWDGERGALVPVSINVGMLPLLSDGPLAQFLIPRS